MLPAGMPGTMIVEGRVRNGNGYLRAHEHQRLPGRIARRAALRAQPLGEEHHRRDTDAAAEQQRARPLGVRSEGLADRAEHAHLIARLVPGERVKARALHLVEQLDPARLRIRAHDRERPAHRDGGVAGDVHEAAGLGVRGASRRRRARSTNCSRLVGELRDDARRLEKDGAAGARARRRAGAHRRSPGAGRRAGLCAVRVTWRLRARSAPARAPPCARRRRCAPGRG